MRWLQWEYSLIPATTRDYYPNDNCNNWLTWQRNVEQMREMRNAYRLLVTELQVKKALGRSKHGCGDSAKVNIINL
jgi:hypothetical protein